MQISELLESAEAARETKQTERAEDYCTQVCIMYYVSYKNFTRISP